MSISITDRSKLLDDELRQMAERRLRFALSRFDSRIARVQMTVFEEHGPRGSLEKACRVFVTLHRADDVMVAGRDADMADCIARTTDRVGRAVARAIEMTLPIDPSRPLLR